MFSTKRDKMDYVRDYYKLIAFNIFKIRAESLSEDPYIIIKKIIIELYNIFGDYDKVIKYDTKLYNPAIIINFKKNKIFDVFYARFSVIIVSLSYSEAYKIFNLKRFIIIKLRSRIADFISIKTGIDIILV